jgi:iron complex outermembrane recepter protein
MSSNKIALAVLAGALVKSGLAHAQQLPPQPAPPIQTAPATPSGPAPTQQQLPPAAATPPAISQSQPPSQQVVPPTVVPSQPSVSPPAPATPPAAVAQPPALPPQQNGQVPAPTAPLQGQTASPPATSPQGPSVQVPEVQITLPEAVQPTVTPPKKAATQPKPPTRAVARTPAIAAKPAVAPPQAQPQSQAPATTAVPAPSQTPPSQTLPAAQSGAATPSPELGTQVKLSPVGGSEVPIAKVAAAVSTVSAAQIAQQGSSSLQATLQTKVPGVIVNDLQGNDFQTDVQYRGFSASPVDGVSQGLAVYQNGVRINEAFGDTVNWSAIPSVAISDIAVTSNNPAFGLNAIGGAISIGMKTGFNYQGSEIDGRIGSFGRRQGSVQTGMKSGAFGLYAAYEDISDDGWRDFSPSKIKRFYGDLGVKNGDDELHVTLTRSRNFVGATAAAPVELLSQQGWNRTYTSPQTTLNDITMPTINGTVAINNTLKLSGVGYYRKYKQRSVDGNLTNAEDCGDPLTGTLCLNGDPVLDQNGNSVASTTANGTGVLGEIDRSSINSQSYGGSLQAVDKSKLFGHGNQFLIGGSIDHGVTAYRTSAEFGTVDPGSLFVTGTGQFASAPFDLSPRNLRATNDYYGLFFSNVFDVTDAFTVTVGGRYNLAKIELQDLTGAEEAAALNGKHTYSRFNPGVGATYKLMQNLTVYGGYSESNRAPTPVELACSDPNRPCVITSFLTADPELRQVVGRTVEAGLRGELGHSVQSGKIDWSFGIFRTLSSDDIIPVASLTQGRGYFQNAGDTLRQGLEASATYRDDRLMLTASYNYLEATFESDLVLVSLNNPRNPNPGDPYFINVRPGNRIPGVPQHKGKVGVEYFMTPEWKVGADLLLSSSQYFRGDENNVNQQLSGYATVNLKTSYDINKTFQIYGLINNVFDARFSNYGTYFSTTDANSIGNQVTFTDPRTITPATPFAAYGGMKIRF